MILLVLVWILGVVVYPASVIWVAVSVFRRTRRAGKALLSCLLPLLVLAAGVFAAAVVVRGVDDHLDRHFTNGK